MKLLTLLLILLILLKLFFTLWRELTDDFIKIGDLKRYEMKAIEDHSLSAWKKVINNKGIKKVS